jgi:glycosyltransferase involved in cell wall biosynthesis
MTGSPRLSVVMPMRDAGDFLDAAIESILAQTFADFEFIIVDDGSRDGSRRRVDRYADADKRILVMSSPGEGIVEALNRGIRLARGSLIARMDADDIALPHRFATQIAALAAWPEVGVVGSNYTAIDIQGRPVRDIVLPSAPQTIREGLLVGNCIAHPTVMMRRDAVFAAGLYRADFPLCEDYDLWLRMSETTDLINLPEILLRYRLHLAQATASGLERRLRSEVEAMNDALRRRGGAVRPVAREIRDRAMTAARGMIGEKRRSDAFAALRVAAGQGAIGPMATLRWMRLMCKAALA